MSEQENLSQTDPSVQTADQATPGVAGVPSEAGAETAAGKTEEKEEHVRYELVEATQRAGSIVDLKFKVAYEEYDRKMQQFFKDLRQTVIIDGFRRGKAPLRLIQNRYHKEVKQDTLDYLLADCLGQITAEKGYTALREFDRVDPEVVEGQEMAFAISLEIRPKIDPIGYDHFDLTLDTHEITEATVGDEIEKLRRRYATYQTAELSAWQPGLALTADLRVVNDKNIEIEELTRKDLFLRRPDVALPEPVVEQLRGRHAGDFVVVSAPNERKSEGGVLVSQHDVYQVKILEVKREVLPEINDQFAQDVGSFKTVQELHDRVRKDLQTGEEKRIREQALDKIYGLLFERNPFDVPKTLTTQMADDLAREHQERLHRMGYRLEDLGEDMEAYSARTEATAERMIRLVLLKNAIADKEKVAATDEAVERAIARKAEEEGRKPLAVRARLEAQKAMDRFREDLRYDLVDDFLLARANISKQFVSAEPKIATPGSP